MNRNDKSDLLYEWSYKCIGKDVSPDDLAPDALGCVESLSKIIQYRNLSGEPFQNIHWHLMVHLVNHGTQHRSEAAVMLTDFGHSPGDIDFLFFLGETR